MLPCHLTGSKDPILIYPSSHFPETFMPSIYLLNHVRLLNIFQPADIPLEIHLVLVTRGNANFT